MRAVSDPQPSPDGSRILYTVRTTDVANNRRTPATFIIASSGGAPHAFPSADVAATEARWSPDGRHIAYIAGGQLWIADADGANAQAAHAAQRRRDRAGLGTDERSHRVHVGRLSGLHDRRMQRRAGQGARRQQGEGARRRPTAVPPLERVGRRHALAPVRRRHRRQRAADLIPGAKYDVPPRPFGGSEATRCRPTDVRSRTRRRIRDATTRRRRTSTSTRFRSTGGSADRHHRGEQGRRSEPGVFARRPLHRLRVAGARRLRVGSLAAHGLRSRRRRRRASCCRAGTATPTGTSGRPTCSAIYVATTDAGRDKLYRVPLERGTAVRVAQADAPQLVVGDHNNAAFSLVARRTHASSGSRDATESPGRSLRRRRRPRRRATDGARGHARERRARRRSSR